MKIRLWQNQVDLSVIVIFFNMRREAERTLHSLSRAYQKNILDLSYEVIAIDNGSTEPLDEESVKSCGTNFRYVYFDTSIPSPCLALNYGVQIARGTLVTLCIDGARILSPGILHHSLLAARMYKDPFIYTLSMHIGNKTQNDLAEENYSQQDEDILLDSVDWRQNGYSLFDISTVAPSSGTGYFSKLNESNCITMPRSAYSKVGGFDERFESAGGGLANLDFFNRLNRSDDLHPVMLLGEATFHQFHRGTATNVPLKDHPWKEMQEEYISITGKPYRPHRRKPVYFGEVHSKCYHLLDHSKESW
jgi:glycosyltransferase involved in cell wall biosynthesis